MSIIQKFSIIVVNYYSTVQLNKLIESLSPIQKWVLEIIIIDNNTKDFETIFLNKNKKNIIIRNKINNGFAAAVNQGIKFSKSEIVLIINPDCRIINKSPILTFNKIQKNKFIGAIGGKIIHPDTGTYQLTATRKPNFFTGLFEFTNLKKIFPNNRYSRLFWVEKKHDITKPIQVFSLCGAYIFLRKNGFYTQNYLNEKYFLYLEDLDLGYTITQNHNEVWFDPESTISHIGGSSNSSKYNIVLNHWYKSRKIFYLDHLNIIGGSILYIIFILEEKILSLYHLFTSTPND